MSRRPGVFTIPDGPEKLFLPSKNLSVSSLIKFTLPPQRKSTIFLDPSDYLSEDFPTVDTFHVAEIAIPPSNVVKALGRAIQGGIGIKISDRGWGGGGVRRGP
ncbi:hypothetical protein R3P38DRAFT_2796698 [Favolaschia claudopus]|uniref:Uncharacterized protein n=1 Tax=Favolaschia claudopus TaxID=2862362 RepID=A0AAW0A507_9AGAR